MLYQYCQPEHLAVTREILYVLDGSVLSSCPSSRSVPFAVLDISHWLGVRVSTLGWLRVQWHTGVDLDPVGLVPQRHRRGAAVCRRP